MATPCLANRGAALLICLMLLFALTFLGLAAANDSQLQRRMGANMDAMNRAHHAATAGLAWAEAWLFSLDGGQHPTPCVDSCSGDDVIRAAGSFPQGLEHAPSAWWAANANIAGLDPTSGALLDPTLSSTGSLWLVEEVRFEPAIEADPLTAETTPDLAYYRIIARGKDRAGGNVAVMESILARAWGNTEWSSPLPPNAAVAGLCHDFEPEVPCGRQGWRKTR